ncbi:hypothetical protein HDU91_004935 [Kappamyces sp. JEL0680]|nr:hypothetical protein HDU91_004935 [Kappamyces sp. JEL0680]
MSDQSEPILETIASNTTSWKDSLLEFGNNVVQDPFGTLYHHPVFCILVLLAVGLPPLLRHLFPSAPKRSSNVGLVSEPLDGDSFRDRAAEAPKTTIPWELGVSGRSASVSAQGILRAIEFTPRLTKPTPAHVVATLLKAIVEPIDKDSKIEKPEVVAFLDTVLLNEKEKATIIKQLASLSIKAVSMEALKRDMPELAKKRTEVAAPAPAPVAAPPTATGPQQVLPFNPAPPRGCVLCKKDIAGKASQCSACKAIIYDSADCAKKDWPNHKQVCSEFKASMDHVADWNLHDFPFTFYNKSKILHNYNAVPFLTTHSLHNVGLFQRLCGCFQQVPWGGLNANLLAQFQANRPTPEQMFAALGLPQEMFPLSKPFPDGTDVSGIDSWSSYFQARGYSLDSPAALILEVPLTLWHLINQFHLKTAPAVPEGQKRRITVHLVGAEKEADLLPLFECLLPFFPKTDLAIHMIGNNISPDIPPQQRAMAIRSVANESSIFVSVTTSLYQPQHLDGSAFQLPDNIPAEIKASQNFGDCPPDLVIAMNAALVVHGEWAPVLAMIGKSGTKFLATERMEQLCNSAKANMPRLNTSVTVDTHPNPFRQPLYEFKKDVNLPGWSNGYIIGIGSGFD